MPANDPYELPRHEEHAEAVGEARVRRAREDEFREAELPDPAKPPEGWRLDDAPKHLLELVGAEFDQIVDRAADALRFRRRDPFSLMRPRLVPSQSRRRASSVPPLRRARLRTGRRASTSSRNRAGQNWRRR